jgi:hypothetical protein
MKRRLLVERWRRFVSAGSLQRLSTGLFYSAAQFDWARVQEINFFAQ